MSENLVDPDSFVLAKIKLVIVMAALQEIRGLGGPASDKAELAFADLVDAMKIMHMDISEETIM